ncbi:MAG: hypothetical protein CL920_27560 [Deltaproteobacteria bacterium]|nr:hypothetical protein [Deltaproteobacteria bacterium]MBU52469.1 hypothetical protein [Deltaproteobacteria bacterium]|tara:strand:- start:12235 stop:13116 length:882 start_codon:yes stop_codon:yes gene_type:complete
MKFFTWGTLLCLIFGCGVPEHVFALSSSSVQTKKPLRLYFSRKSGSITVRFHKQTSVFLKKTDESGQVPYDIRKSGQRVDIVPSHRTFSIDAVTVWAPYGSRLFLKTLGKVKIFPGARSVDVYALDSIDVQGVSGGVKVQTVSGSIVLKQVGPAKVISVAGDIEVRDVKGDLSVRTVSGDVTIERVNGASFRGKTVSGNLTLTQMQVSSVLARSFSGNVQFTGGSAQFKKGSFQAYSGDLSVTWRRGLPVPHIKTSTSVGDVDIPTFSAKQQRQGQFVFRTQTGNISWGISKK